MASKPNTQVALRLLWATRPPGDHLRCGKGRLSSVQVVRARRPYAAKEAAAFGLVHDRCTRARGALRSQFGRHAAWAPTTGTQCRDRDWGRGRSRDMQDQRADSVPCGGTLSMSTCVRLHLLEILHSACVCFEKCNKKNKCWSGSADFKINV